MQLQHLNGEICPNAKQSLSMSFLEYWEQDQNTKTTRSCSQSSWDWEDSCFGDIVIPLATFQPPDKSGCMAFIV